MLKTYTISLGCPKNRVDTEKLLGSLPSLELVENIEDASFVLINTCAFIAPAIKESVQAIAQAIADISDLPRKPLLAVAGCLIGRYGQEPLASEFSEVDLWLDNREIASWNDKLFSMLGLRSIPQNKRLLSTPASYAWLKISDGCKHKCSFCTIPYIRGAHHSFSIASIKQEAVSLLEQGVKEIVLVAQDLTAWGSDLNLSLPHLLDELLPLKNLARLRLMYAYPSGLTENLLAYLQGAGAPFVPYFDVPVQHADPEILQKMGRPFASDPYKIIERIRKHFPEAALRTSLIVGFPSETQAQFDNLLRFVEEVKFTHLGVFAYQAEDGTQAAKMPKQVRTKIKEERRNIIMSTQKDISAEYLQQFVGEELDILIDSPHEEWDGLFIGRAPFQAPEFDGQVYISGDGVAIGNIVRARIIETSEYDLNALL